METVVASGMSTGAMFSIGIVVVLAIGLIMWKRSKSDKHSSGRGGAGQGPGQQHR